MSVRSIISLVVFVASIIVAEKIAEPATRIELLNPKGFRFSMKNDPGFSETELGLAVYKKLEDDLYEENASEEYHGNLLVLQKNNWWTYESFNSSLGPGDRVFFIALYTVIMKNGETYHNGVSPESTFEYIPENATRISV